MRGRGYELLAAICANHCSRYRNSSALYLNDSRRPASRRAGRVATERIERARTANSSGSAALAGIEGSCTVQPCRQLGRRA